MGRGGGVGVIFPPSQGLLEASRGVATSIQYRMNSYALLLGYKLFP